MAVADAAEQWIADTATQTAEERAALLEAAGVTHDAALTFGAALDAEMGRCIVALYRSAIQPAMAEWGRDAEAAAARPGLVLAPTDDPFTGGTGGAERMSERLGAQFRALDGLGHWWMLARRRSRRHGAPGVLGVRSECRPSGGSSLPQVIGGAVRPGRLRPGSSSP